MRRWVVLAAVLVVGIVAVVAWVWPTATPLTGSPAASSAPAIVEQPLAEQPAEPAPQADPVAAPAAPSGAAAPLTVVAPTVASNGHLTIRLLGHTTGP